MEQPSYTYGYRSDIDWDSIPDSEAAIIENLPHGSGIDYDWYIEVNTAGKVVAYNAYHIMDEYGYYRVPVSFSLRWDPSDQRSFRLMFHTDSQGWYWIERTDLRFYLEELFAYVLSEHGD